MRKFKVKWILGTGFTLIILILLSKVCVARCEIAKPTATINVDKVIVKVEVTKDAEFKSVPVVLTKVVPEPVAVKTCTYYDVPLDRELQAYIVNLCEEYNIDPAVVIAMIDIESKFCVTAMGDNGNSYGLMQIQKRYHSERMAKLGVTDLLNPYENVAVGIDFLAELIEHYHGDVGMALVAYNAGIGGAYEHWFSKGLYSSYYSRYVLSLAESLSV